jgi:Mlc titration factor MtfA (ptsG expression regulator)
MVFDRMLFRWLTERRRARLLESEFPAAWAEHLSTNVKAYPLLDETEQKHLRDLVQVFIAEKHWEGCGGLELTDEMRVTIAGSACIMILARDHDLLKEIESILVYPSAVVLPDQQAGFFDGSPRIVGEGTDVLGLAHMGGPMVLAWDNVLEGSRNVKDGRNLVIHEVAHKIDFLDGDADGTPPLDTKEQRRAWARACSEAFLAHKDGDEHLLRDYATTNEAEFFAVASEMFFERPKRFAKELPALYAVMRDFYKLDLAAR